MKTKHVTYVSHPAFSRHPPFPFAVQKVLWLPPQFVFLLVYEPLAHLQIF